MRQWLQKDMSEPYDSEQMVEVISQIVECFLIPPLFVCLPVSISPNALSGLVKLIITIAD